MSLMLLHFGVERPKWRTPLSSAAKLLQVLQHVSSRLKSLWKTTSCNISTCHSPNGVTDGGLKRGPRRVPSRVVSLDDTPLGLSRHNFRGRSSCCRHDTVKSSDVDRWLHPRVQERNVRLLTSLLFSCCLLPPVCHRVHCLHVPTFDNPIPLLQSFG